MFFWVGKPWRQLGLAKIYQLLWLEFSGQVDLASCAELPVGGAASSRVVALFLPAVFSSSPSWWVPFATSMTVWGAYTHGPPLDLPLVCAHT